MLENFQYRVNKQISFLYKQVQCLRNVVCPDNDCCDCGCNDCQCSDYPTLITGNTTDFGGSDGFINEEVRTRRIDALNDWLFIEKIPYSVSGYKGHVGIRFNEDKLRSMISVGGVDFGEIRFKWGKRSMKFTNPEFILNEGVRNNYYYRANINGINIVVPYLFYDITMYDLFSRYNNITLLIDRYKNVQQKAYNLYSHAGYKHEPLSVALSNGRRSEILLNSPTGKIKFGVENYFNWAHRPPKVRGVRNSFRSLRLFDMFGYGPVVYIGFRLRFSREGNTYESGYLGYLRFMPKYVNERLWLMTIKIQ